MRPRDAVMIGVLLGLVGCGDDATSSTTSGSSTSGASSSGATTSPTTTSAGTDSSGSTPTTATTGLVTTGFVTTGGDTTFGETTATTSSSSSGGDTIGATTTGGTTTGGTTTGGSSGGSSGTTGGVGPGECNELLGVPCAIGQFCDYPDDMCGAGLNGTCQPNPMACPLFFDPHCGCDGVTHSNACIANSNGTDIDYAGPC